MKRFVVFSSIYLLPNKLIHPPTHPFKTGSVSSLWLAWPLALPSLLRVRPATHPPTSPNHPPTHPPTHLQTGEEKPTGELGVEYTGARFAVKSEVGGWVGC